jgi:hypothetical protein
MAINYVYDHLPYVLTRRIIGQYNTHYMSKGQVNTGAFAKGTGLNLCEKGDIGAPHYHWHRGNSGCRGGSGTCPEPCPGCMCGAS